MVEKIINFDMDGTLADLYGVENWLQYLQNGDEYPYSVAKPLLNLSTFARYINKLQSKGYKVNIISWLCKNSNAEYDELVTIAKLEWLQKHLKSVTFDEIYILPYGTPKNTISCGYLFDDEEHNRNMWGEGAYDVHNILGVLKEMA